MKQITFLIFTCSVFGLAACGKSKLEERIEQDTAISKKMGGDVNKVPRTVMSSEDKNKNENGAK